MTAIEHVTKVEIVGTPEQETAAAVKLIKDGLDSLWEGLARFVTVEGWKVLGYTSFRRWAADEMAMSLGRADLHLRKTKRLLEMSQAMNKTIAELAPTVSIRSGHRKTVRSPIAAAMKTSSRKLSVIPALTDPHERSAATELRNHLNRLLGET